MVLMVRVIRAGHVRLVVLVLLGYLVFRAHLSVRALRVVQRVQKVLSGQLVLEVLPLRGILEFQPDRVLHADLVLLAVQPIRVILALL